MTSTKTRATQLPLALAVPAGEPAGEPMRHDSAIGWLHLSGYRGRTWNPIRGCTHDSRGCLNCYADTLHTMRHKAYLAGKKVAAKYATPFDVVEPWPAALDAPLHWRQPSFIFLSMADLFHEALPDDYIRRIFAVMADPRCSHHVFQMLTKRSARLAQMAPSLPWPRNLWMGVSIEDGRHTYRLEGLEAVKRASPHTITTVSGEPLLGSLLDTPRPLDLTHVDWLIVGWESGAGARPWPSKQRIAAQHLTPADVAARIERERERLMTWTREARDLALASGHTALFVKQFADPTGHKIEAPELDGRQWLEWPRWEAA